MNDTEIAISVDDVSKRYRLGIKEDVQNSLGGALVNLFKSPLKNYRKYRSLYKFEESNYEVDPGSRVDTEDILWALRGVTFNINRGEVVGIIGTNGAGKSTLLKILSRITPPTTGRIKMRGRVSSLLEVGTGFHAELTGRENVYMNGTILGMRKREIDQRFDQIVDFSGVEKFLDTPVKRYSSGMRVRLAFSVAAHLEPEILIIDEVLAVGDVSFQKKCMKKMEVVGQEGRTVLFVSHNMPAITRMCNRVILLNRGEVSHDGTANEVVSYYLKGEQDSTACRYWEDLTNAPGRDIVRLRAVRVLNKSLNVKDAYDITQPIGLNMEYEILRSGFSIQPRFIVTNDAGVQVFANIDNDPEWKDRSRPKGRYNSIAWIPGNLLAEGLLYVSVKIATLNPVPQMQFHERDVVAFQVIDHLGGDSVRGDWVGPLAGVVRPMLKWETQYSADEEMPLNIVGKEETG